MHSFSWPASADQPPLLRQLHRLGAPACAEFVEDTAGVRLDGVLADEHPRRDLLVAQPFGDQLEHLERAAIVRALEASRYNKTAAAKQLGMTFRALRYRIKKLGIE